MGANTAEKDVREHQSCYIKNPNKHTFELRDERIIRWVTDNCGVEIRSRTKVGVNVRLSSGIDRGSVVFSLVEDSFEITESVLGNHRTDIRVGFEPFDGRSENRSGSKFLGASHDHIVKLFVLGLMNDELFDADAVLTSVLAEQHLVNRVK